MLAALVLVNAVPHRAVVVTSLAKVTVRHVFIRRYRRAFDHVLRDRDFKVIGRRIRNDLREDGAIALNNAHDDSLVIVDRLGLALVALAKTTNNGFIGFDAARRSGQRIATPTFRELQNRLAHGPRNPQVHGHCRWQRSARRIRYCRGGRSVHRRP